MKMHRQIACVSIFFVFLIMITGTVAGAAFAPEVDMELVGHLGGVTYAVDIIGNYAYVGEGQDIVIWDVTNPSSPIQMSKIMTNGLVRDIKHSGNYAYVADDSNGLVIIDIGNPSSPIVKGTCHTESAAIDVSVSGNYAYIADDDWINGLVVVDVSDPSSPFIKGVCRTDRFAYGVSVSGNYAYVACEAYGLEIVDISNPSSPTIKGQVAGNAHDVTVLGNYAYVADASNGLVIIDISNPSSPITKGNISGEAFSVSVFGNYAYVHDLLNGLEIVDISNPSSPLIKGNIAANAQSVSVSSNYAYVADFGNGITIVDISNPSSPIINGKYHTAGYGTSAYGATVLGNYTYVADASHGLLIADVSNPSSPTFVGRCDIAGEGATAKDVSVSGDYAYVADDKYGLVIVDVSNPSSPIIKGRYYTWGPVEGVSVSGNYVYIVDSVWGFKILDISNPSTPITKGEISGGAYGVSVSGNYAYITTSNGLKIVDVSNPSSPIIKGSYSPINYPRGISVSGNYAYVANGNYGLVIVDISNPSSPMIKGSYYSGGNAHDVSISGNYAYVSDESNLVIVNVSDPSYPTLAGSYPTAGTTNDVLVSGNDVYVADGDNCLVILEAHILNQELTNGPLIQVEGSSEVYLIENGMKRHFTSPEALEWNGYSLENITTVTSQTLQNYPDGEDISISQPIIDKYHALGGAPIFGAPAGDGEKTGEPDQDGNYCSYVNFEKGAIERFANGPNAGNAYAIVDQFYMKWASMGYGKSVIGYPISDMSEERTSSKNTPYKYQLFTNGTQLGALEWNLNTNQVCEVHGAIFAKWAEIGFASSVLGLPTGDEQDIASSKYGTVGRYGTFENGHIHWNQATGLSFVTYGALNECYNNIQGTQSDLGFPIMNQVGTTDEHDYCEFEKGCIEWNANSGKYEPNYSPNINQKIETRLKVKPHFPPYLLDPNYVGSTSVLWMQFTNFVFNTDLTENYDKLYNDGIKYHGIRNSYLWNAKQSLKNNDITGAEKFIERADKMQRLSDMSFSAANDVFIGNAESAEILAKGVRDECEFVCNVGSAWIPGASLSVIGKSIKLKDAMFATFAFVDICKETKIDGLEGGAKQFATQAITYFIVHKLPLDSLGGKTIEQATEAVPSSIPSDSVLNKEIVGALLKPETHAKLMAAGVEAGITVEDKAITKIVNYYIENMCHVLSVSEAINDPISYETVQVYSPVELQVYDSTGRVTGLVNGVIKNEIPNSIYEPELETVLIYMATDKYLYEVVGTANATYGLKIVHSENMTDQEIILTDVPVIINAKHTYDVDWENEAQVNKTVTTDEELVPPQSISNIQSTNGTTWINWTWTNPTYPDFNHAEIYLNGIFQTNTSTEYFNATDLQPKTNYILGTRTVDNYGNVNETWVNSTAMTSEELVSDAEKPVIQSVALYPANTTAGSKINITVSATDNVGVAEVKAGNIQLLKDDNGIWNGNITAPSSVGSYSLVIKVNDSAGNSAEKAENYKVVSPIGSLGVGISPKTTTASTSGKTIDYTVKIKSVQNFDDVVRINVTMDGLPVNYQVPSEWFDWNNQKVNVASNSTISLPLKLTIPPGQAAGKKVFKVRANSTFWITTAFDSGVITIS